MLVKPLGFSSDLSRSLKLLKKFKNTYLAGYFNKQSGSNSSWHRLLTSHISRSTFYEKFHLPIFFAYEWTLINCFTFIWEILGNANLKAPFCLWLKSSFTCDLCVGFDFPRTQLTVSSRVWFWCWTRFVSFQFHLKNTLAPHTSTRTGRRKLIVYDTFLNF